MLQEANVNLAQLMRDEGFYVERRKMSAPIKKRSKASFGSAFPIELPTNRELDIFAEGCVAITYAEWPHCALFCVQRSKLQFPQTLHSSILDWLLQAASIQSMFNACYRSFFDTQKTILQSSKLQ